MRGRAAGQGGEDEGRAAESVSVCVGPGVHLVFVEGADGADLGEPYTDMEGVHLCVYTADFWGLYQRLQSRGLTWTNPRFTHVDTPIVDQVRAPLSAGREIRC